MCKHINVLLFEERIYLPKKQNIDFCMSTTAGETKCFKSKYKHCLLTNRINIGQKHRFQIG